MKKENANSISSNIKPIKIQNDMSVNFFMSQNAQSKRKI